MWLSTPSTLQALQLLQFYTPYDATSVIYGNLRSKVTIQSQLKTSLLICGLSVEMCTDWMLLAWISSQSSICFPYLSAANSVIQTVSPLNPRITFHSFDITGLPYWPRMCQSSCSCSALFVQLQIRKTWDSVECLLDK